MTQLNSTPMGTKDSQSICEGKTPVEPWEPIINKSFSINYVLLFLEINCVANQAEANDRTCSFL